MSQPIERRAFLQGSVASLLSALLPWKTSPAKPAIVHDEPFTRKIPKIEEVQYETFLVENGCYLGIEGAKMPMLLAQRCSITIPHNAASYLMNPVDVSILRMLGPTASMDEFYKTFGDISNNSRLVLGVAQPDMKTMSPKEMMAAAHNMAAHIRKQRSLANGDGRRQMHHMLEDLKGKNPVLHAMVVDVLHDRKPKVPQPSLMPGFVSTKPDKGMTVFVFDRPVLTQVGMMVETPSRVIDAYGNNGGKDFVIEEHNRMSIAEGLTMLCARAPERQDDYPFHDHGFNQVGATHHDDNPMKNASKDDHGFESRHPRKQTPEEREQDIVDYANSNRDLSVWKKAGYDTTDFEKKPDRIVRRWNTGEAVFESGKKFDVDEPPG